MKIDIKDERLFFKTEQVLRQGQMSRAADGQKLRDALKHSED
jgi:hypothetical protein